MTVAPLAEPNPAAAELATGNTAALADRTETLPAVETIATTTASQRIASPSEGGAAGPGLAKARAIGVEMADGPTVAMSTHEGAVAAPQSACGKLRDKGTRRVESPFVAAAYAETIGAQTGGNYGVPRDQLITLDEALDTHGPRGDLGRRLEWLRGAVGEFARQVRADEENATRYRHGYDPKGFLKWANDGGIRRFREQMRREAAEAAAREASGAPVFDAQAEELEAAMAILEAVKQGADGPFFEGLTIEMAEARLAKAKAAFEAKQAKRQAASKRQANAEANPKQTSNGSGASEVAHG